MFSEYIVLPRSKKRIHEVARSISMAMPESRPDGWYLHLDLFLERLPDFLSDFEFNVAEWQRMEQEYVRNWPQQRLMWIREDIYDGMCQGNARERFIVAHEIGHIFLHPEIPFTHAWDMDAKAYRRSERQANIFASALLIDEKLLEQCTSVEQVMARFGVSRSTAKTRFLESVHSKDKDEEKEMRHSPFACLTPRFSNSLT